MNSKKPTGQYEIDWSHPLARGLVGAWVFSDSLINLAKANPAQAGGDVLFDIHGANLDSTGRYIRIDPYYLLSGDKDTYSVTQSFKKVSASGGAYPRLWQRGDVDNAVVYRDEDDYELSEDEITFELI